VIWCEPSASPEVEYSAWPLASSPTVDKVVDPSIKEAVPVGTVVPALGATVAVNVTSCPAIEGLREETRVVVFDACWAEKLATTLFGPSTRRFCGFAVPVRSPEKLVNR
jgi:hypothetical protein